MHLALGARPVRPRRLLLGCLTLALAIGSVGCVGLYYRAAIPFLYEEAALAPQRIVPDVSYRSGPGADAEKHTLDLFLGEGPNWPVVVFVHGGGWTRGDRGLRIGGADIYRNIGRYFASQGVGVAVISYRLQPDVDWRSQVEDVADATAWVHENIERYGGNPDALFLSGHSAGAQLVTHVALRPKILEADGVPRSDICGLIPVSGAAFDLADEMTYQLNGYRGFYEARFRGDDPSDAWKREASPIHHISRDMPPTLVVYAGSETAALQRQSSIFFEAARSVGADSELLVVPGENHSSILLTMSRPDKRTAPAMLAFIRDAPCSGSDRGATASAERIDASGLRFDASGGE